MNRIFNWLLVAMFAMSMCALGCGDDDDDDNGNGGNDTGTDTSGDVAEETGDDDQGTADVTDEPAEGACTNTADYDIIRGGTVDVEGEATTCGVACATDADPVSCSTPCIVDATDVSEPCATCYAEMINCTAENCLSFCLVDPSSDDCFNCQTENGCFTTFYECSGLDPEE